MLSHRTHTILSCLLLLGGSLFAADAPAPPEARVKEAFKLLANAPVVQVKATGKLVTQTKGQQTKTETVAYRLTMQRPNLFKLQITQNGTPFEIVSDGKILRLSSSKAKQFVLLPVPSSIANLIGPRDFPYKDLLKPLGLVACWLRAADFLPYTKKGETWKWQKGDDGWLMATQDGMEYAIHEGDEHTPFLGLKSWEALDSLGNLAKSNDNVATTILSELVFSDWDLKTPIPVTTWTITALPQYDRLSDATLMITAAFTQAKPQILGGADTIFDRAFPDLLNVEGPAGYAAFYQAVYQSILAPRLAILNQQTFQSPARKDEVQAIIIQSAEYSALQICSLFQYSAEANEKSQSLYRNAKLLIDSGHASDPTLACMNAVMLATDHKNDEAIKQLLNIVNKSSGVALPDPDLYGVYQMLAAQYYSLKDNDNLHAMQANMIRIFSSMFESSKNANLESQRVTYANFSSMMNTRFLNREELWKYLQTRPDRNQNWMVQMLLGRICTDQAWLIRGGDYAANTAEDNMNQFMAIQSQAFTYFKRAHSLQPKAPEAATDLIGIVATISDNAAKDMAFYLQEAMRAEYDYLPAFYVSGLCS
jgi:hypothetical protein